MTYPSEHAELIERLSRHERLRGVPRAELEWLAENGELLRLVRGEFLARTGDPREAQHLNVVLSGHLTASVLRGRVQRKVQEIRAGDFVGLLPFSRMGRSPGEIVADELVEMLRVESRLFTTLIRDCPGVTAACVHSMIDRRQYMTESQLHDEKMFSLGKLAAGLAHELNNPASAVLRGVDALGLRQREIETSAAAVEDWRLSAEQRATLRKMRDQLLAEPRWEISPLDRAEREDGIADWLHSHSLDPVSADSLVDAGITDERLETLAGAIPGAALGPAIVWIASSIDASALLAEMGQAVRRMHSLITAVKGFTQMDRPLGPEPTRIAPGMRDTISVMSPKAQARSVTIDLDVPDELPPVRASAAELNQVWASLIDNALDAAPTQSSVAISARTLNGRVVVSVVDQGSGIPEDIRGLIFDPFFTTKPIGHGRGLGLDTARRIVTMAEGEIEFDSGAGRTEFRVLLPIAGSPEPSARA